VDHYLCLDLLSVHVIRHVDGNTIISLHLDQDLPTTGAEQLHDRIQFAGQSLILNDLANVLHRHMQDKAYIGKKCFTNRMILLSYCSPSSGTQCIHGVRH